MMIGFHRKLYDLINIDGNITSVIQNDIPYCHLKSYDLKPPGSKYLAREAQQNFHEEKDKCLFWTDKWRTIHQTRSKNFLLLNLAGIRLILYTVNHKIFLDVEARFGLKISKQLITKMMRG